MRYIAKKNDEDFTITGIKEMETPTGEKVEVIFASKDYDKEQLEGIVEQLTEEKDLAMERYLNDIKDLTAMLDAIKNCK